MMSTMIQATITDLLSRMFCQIPEDLTTVRLHQENLTSPEQKHLVLVIMQW